ncbi:hypothetical protein P5V15_012828 [Pogonomyrmex californicus]
MENYYIIVGDFNAKHISWKNLNNNLRGIALKKWIDNNDINQKIKLLSSRYPSYPNGNSYLDLVMADSMILFHNIRNDCDLENIPYDSDHDAVKFDICLDDENGLELEPVIIKYKYNFRKTNWEKFTKTLHGKITNNIP